MIEPTPHTRLVIYSDSVMPYSRVRFSAETPALAVFTPTRRRGHYVFRTAERRRQGFWNRRMSYVYFRSVWNAKSAIRRAGMIEATNVDTTETRWHLLGHDEWLRTGELVMPEPHVEVIILVGGYR